MTTKFIEYTSEDNLVYFHHSLNSAAEKSLFYPPEFHDKIELLYLKQGILSYHVEGVPYKVSPGDIILINSRQLHSLSIDLSKPYERYVLQFSEMIFPNNIAIIRTLYTNLSQHNNLQCRLLKKETVEQHKLSQFFLSLAKQGKELDKYFYPTLIASIIQLLIEINKIIETKDERQDNLYHPTVQKIIAYVNENLEKAITVKDIAGHVYLNEYYTNHLFQKYMRMSLKQYVNLKKMQLAVTLIDLGEKPTQVAQKLGYNNYSTFYQRYVAINKISPNQNPKNRNFAPIETRS